MPPSLDRSVRPLLAVAAALLAGGVALAVLEPGDLGEETATTAATSTTTSTTTAPSTETTSGGQVVATDTTATTAGPTTATTAAPGTTATTATTAAPASTATTVPGSGLGTDGASRADDGTADTGIESMLGPGLALAAGSALLRRATRRA